MASLVKKIGNALRYPSVAWQYVTWRAKRAVHIEPVIHIPGGGRIVTTGKFNDYRGIFMQHPGEAEFNTLTTLMESGSAVFVDVGANVGQMTVLAARTGKVARILAFEPTHAYAAAWHSNVVGNGVSNATLIQAACAAQPGTITFVVNVSTPMHNRIAEGAAVRRYTGDAGYQQHLTAVTLDAACEAAGITRIDLLKIDVEGAEYKVLSGATGLLKRRAIRTIYTEFIPEYIVDMGDEPLALAELLASNGFEFSALRHDGSLGRLLTPKDVADRKFEGLNVVARLSAGAPA